MNLEQASQLKLNIGQQYSFQINDWTTPFGELIAGTVKIRTYIGLERRFVGGQFADFFSVNREDGKQHLIYLGTVKSVEVVA